MVTSFSSTFKLGTSFTGASVGFSLTDSPGLGFVGEGTLLPTFLISEVG